MEMSSEGLRRFRALVTGGGRGLGRGLAIELLRRGLFVTLAVRDPSSAHAAVKRSIPHELHERLEARPIDLSSLASVDAFVSSWAEGGESVDLVVNNAAVCRWEQVRTADGFEESLQVNCISPVRMMIGLSRFMLKSKLKVVLNIGTVPVNFGRVTFERFASVDSYDMSVAYRRSKALLGGMSLELAEDSRFADVRFFYINPGLVRTGLGADSLLGKLGVALSYPFAQSASDAASRTLEAVQRHLSTSARHWPESYAEIRSVLAPALTDARVRRSLWRRLQTALEPRR